jgi:hypothetical protein
METSWNFAFSVPQRKTDIDALRNRARVASRQLSHTLKYLRFALQNRTETTNRLKHIASGRRHKVNRMRRLSTFIMVVMLCLLAVLVAPACRCTQLARTEAMAPTAQATATPPPADQKIDFKPNGALDYFDERGFTGSSQSFISTDGIVVYLTTERRRSTESADEALRENVEAAVRVVEQNTLFDKDGVRIGDRAVAYTHAKDKDEELPTIFRTNEKTFYILESRSLRHLLLFEKQIFSQGNHSYSPSNSNAPVDLRPPTS